MDARLLLALESHEAWLRSRGHPVVQGLRPGVSEDEVREKLAGLGLDAPDGVLTFFGWHNGYHQEPRPDDGWYGRITPSWFPLSLEEACKEFTDLREDFELQEEYGDLVGTEWFPLLKADAFFIVVDCRRDPEHRGRIAVRDWGCELSPSPERRPRSLAVAVETWLGFVNDGLWQWSKDDGWTDSRDPMARTDPVFRGVDPDEVT